MEYVKTDRDINFSVLVGKTLLCRKSNGKEFIGFLARIEGNDLKFRTRNGFTVTDAASSIVYVAEV